MWAGVQLAAAVVVGGCFVISGAAKIRAPRRETAGTFAALGVPAGLDRGWAHVVYPWGELAVGALMLVAPPFAWWPAALAALLMCAALALLVGRVLRSGRPVACSCFGHTEPLTRRSLIRNIALTGCAAIAAASPLPAPSPLWAAGLSDPGPAAGVVFAAAAAAGIAALSHSRWALPIPLLSVIDADGTRRTVRSLVDEGPVLLVHVSSGCSACSEVTRRHADGDIIAGNARIRLIERGLPADGSAPRLWDDAGTATTSLGLRSTPSALLLAADGTVPLKPVYGAAEIEELIEEIEASAPTARDPAGPAF